MLHLAFDKLIPGGYGHPNLAVWQADPYTPQWRQYDRHWPHTVPLRLELFLREFDLPFCCHLVANAPTGSWYPIGISWWDFQTDYVNLLSQAAKDLVGQKRLKLLFYYHEGDNPARIRLKIDTDLMRHGIPTDSAVLVSGNSAAQHIPNCLYFDDFECWFTVLNKHQQPDQPMAGPKPFDFTVLSRTHKWWRATIMHDLDRDGILDHSLWSYGDTDCGDRWEDNPIQCEERATEIRNFVEQGPKAADNLDLNQQNNHHWVNTDLYNKSHFHVILETHFDADQSDGTFLTEKTYKCIKHGQPFLIAGPAGSLQVLRDHGYDVFDNVLDNRYDLVSDNTLRWQTLRRMIQELSTQISDLSKACAPGVLHNQNKFHQRPVNALNNLLGRLI